MTVLGMVISFVAFTFLLLVVLRQFVWAADYVRIATYYTLLLFGIGFVTGNRLAHTIVALVGALFFIGKGTTFLMGILELFLGIFNMCSLYMTIRNI